MHGWCAQTSHIWIATEIHICRFSLPSERVLTWTHHHTDEIYRHNDWPKVMNKLFCAHCGIVWRSIARIEQHWKRRSGSEHWIIYIRRNVVCEWWNVFGARKSLAGSRGDVLDGNPTMATLNRTVMKHTLWIPARSTVRNFWHYMTNNFKGH